MIHLTSAFPIILYIFSLFKENENKVEKYLAASLRYLEVSVPMGIYVIDSFSHIGDRVLESLSGQLRANRECGLKLCCLLFGVRRLHHGGVD